MNMNGTSIENNKLSTSELEALRLTALDLTSELELDELLKMIIGRARELLHAEGGGIYLLDEQDRMLRVKYYLGEGPSMLGTTLHIGEGLVGEVVQKNEEIRVDNYSSWDKRARGLDSTIYRAVIGVPLTTPTKCMGAIYLVNYDEDKTFDDRDAEIFKVLASHAAIALANAEEFQRHRIILRQLQLINDLNEKLRHAVDLDEILQITLEESLKAVDANEGSVMMLDENTGELEIRAWVVKGEKTDAKGHKRFTPDEGVAGHVAKTGEPYNCTDTSASSFFAPSFTKRRIKSLLSVPIILHHRVFCIINADSETENFFTDRDTHMLMALAGHVAIAIESQHLREIGLSLSTLPLEQLYAHIVKDAATLTGSDVATIFILNEGNGEIKRVALFPPTLEIEEEVAREDGLTRRVLSTGKLINLNGADFEASAHPAILRRQAKSLLAAPLNVRIDNVLKTIGVLFVTTKLPAHYDKHDEELLQSLANQAAVAIDRTRNFGELQENNRFKERLLESALDAIVAVDEDGKVLLCNPSAREILNVTSEDVLGTYLKDYFFNSREADHIFTTLADTGSRIVGYHADVKSRMGEPIPIRLSAVRLDKGAVTFFQDRRALESARRHREQLKQLMEAEQAMTALSDEKEVHRMVVDKTVETLGPDVVCLYHYDQSKERMHPRPIVAGTLRSGLNLEEAFSTSFIEKLLRIGDIYFIPTLHNNELLKGYSTPSEIMSLVSCPLTVRNRIVGVILCCYFDFQAFMDEEWKAMVNLYFNGVATAIDNAQLFQEVQQRAGAMRGFYRASMLHFTNSDLNQHLNSLLGQLIQVTNVESASIEIDAGLESGPIFIQQGKESEFIRSKRSVKVQSGGRTVGTLTVANKSRAALNQMDLEYLDMFGASAGGFVERARLREQASAVQSIDVAFVLLSVWNRMIKEKMGSVKNLVESCAEGTVPEIFNELNSSLSALTGLDLGAHSVENDLNQRVDVSRVLTETARQVKDRIELIAVSVGGTRAEALGLSRIEPNCWVKGHKLLLSFAFKILIDNAVSAIEQKGISPVNLRIECLAQQDAIEIWISDTGPGIDPDIKAKLFKVPVPSSEIGSGYGCLTAGMIFKVHNGVIQIADTSSNGTLLKITLPAEN